MMRYFPESALGQLEFDKIRHLLAEKCKSAYAREKASSLRIHTRPEFIQIELQRAGEFKSLLEQGQYFPNEDSLNLSHEIKLLGLSGAVLGADQFLQIRKLAEAIRQIFHWFDRERRLAYPGLTSVIKDSYYEKAIIQMIDEILEDNGQVRDKASPELAEIRMSLYRKRNELRRLFDRILARLNKAGFVAETEEAFLNGRRVVALFAEHKRQIKGILHGESDSRKTSFIEPEETISLNNEIFSLEHAEGREVTRILRDLTAKLSIHSQLLNTYHEIVGEFDFINGKAKFAIDINGIYPNLQDGSHIHLIQAIHPLLFLYHRKSSKPTIPVNIRLDDKNRILVISGPNAGGKTVTMKTVGLLQLMVQAGLLIPVHPHSTLGIFKQIMIHIGDTQSLEFELSTYSSHLLNMKYFMEQSNGRTLFFIDELGSGSDPNLGGAFAEVILLELLKKHAFGIVTTHYLNLKVMANKTAGIINGAMAFDEKSLQPLYQLILGKPGSSYTFSIAERIGLHPDLIQNARKLVDEEHFRLDKLLNRTEQDLRNLEQKEKELQQMLKENAKLKTELEKTLHKEKHLQQLQILQEQNKISSDRYSYLKEMERKLKQIIFDWRKAENKEEVISQMQALLFNRKEKPINEKVKKKFDSKYVEVEGDIQPGSAVKMKKSHQTGTVRELRGKKAIVQIGMIPITMDISDLVLIKEKAKPETSA
ncbi:MAG TPA: MutS2/Smr-associated SH3 domain-containing protein [Puia sp.]|nr:MutS2/Smr-associated SH3 domain-containing protein [Puia sp.]